MNAGQKKHEQAVYPELMHQFLTEQELMFFQVLFKIFRNILKPFDNVVEGFFGVLY